MAIYEQIGSELGLIRALNRECEWNRTLHFCEFEYIGDGPAEDPSPDEDLINEVLIKILKRGTRPFCSFTLEEKIIQLYGVKHGIAIKDSQKNGSITYQYNPELVDRYQRYRDVIEPWTGEANDLTFDTQSIHHEKEFFSNLTKRFPDNIANMIKTQVEISDVIPKEQTKKFAEQRVDFLLTFPNGKSIVFEPGNHASYPANLLLLDKQRDELFLKQGIPTKRLENSEISVEKTYRDIENLILASGGKEYLVKRIRNITASELNENYLFLLPSLVARIEYLLAYFYFNKGLVHRETLNIGFIERDLECAVVALADFEAWVTKLSKLYGIEITLPKVRLFIQGNPIYAPAKQNNTENVFYGVRSFDSCQLDLLLDVAIKCNSSTKPLGKGAQFVGSVRQTAPNNAEIRFGYKSLPRAIDNKEDTDELLETFLQDMFRKWNLREGQAPIIKNILLQKNTIGLLPTSGGKSICYQLASLLTPGTTIVIDPINSLMTNQANSLRRYYGIDRTFAWHSQSAKNQNVNSLLYGHIMVFISPERLQRDSFRSAMQNLRAADIYINYAVIDEAHCISMWGHDFRPSYLMLESNIRKYCRFNSTKPPIIALTGTASQLVLIDMKRELKIDELDSIIRPKSFNRKELHFNLVRSNSKNKENMLETIEISIARRLNVRNLTNEAYGIVFSYFPKDLWKLLKNHQADLVGHVNEIINSDGDQILKFGMYSGKGPNDFPSGLWEDYKKKVLNLFQDGKIRMLFGNNAISVGIDNPKINYVINYCMPQSLEAYYQQSGRAGREGQDSECYLIFSDDNPSRTKQWLNGQIPKMEQRYDDLGTVSYFHESNFPGREIDTEGTQKIFSSLFKSKDPIISITADLDGTLDDDKSSKSEKYISYLTMLGVIKDYEVEGSFSNSRFTITLSEDVQDFLHDNNQKTLEVYLVKKLAEYQNRYAPTSEEDIRKGIGQKNGEPLSTKCIKYLIDFIYDKIEYQRRKAIETVVNFCNEEDTSPERLRSRIVAYLDFSEKFSSKLIALADTYPNVESVIEIISQVVSFEDGENLYYETRRLLDERMRSDWLAANIYAFVFRENGKFSTKYIEELKNLVKQLLSDEKIDKSKFLAVFMSQFLALDEVFKKNIGTEFISKSLFELYKEYGVNILDLIEQLTIPQEEKSSIELIIANYQLEEILDGRYSQIIG